MIIHCTKKLAARLEKAGILISQEPLLTEPSMDAIGSWHANITTIQRRQCDRSVQGTINQMLQDLTWWVQYEGADIMDYPVYSTSVRLSDRPCSVKRMKKTECIWPINEMKQLLLDIKEPTNRS